MNDVKEEVQKRLDKQYLGDLKTVMQTQEGRRMYSYLLEKCGYKTAGIKGNSQDFYLNGRRSVAVDLIFACDAISSGHNFMAGVDLRQQAEREYILLQKSILDDVMHNNK